MKIFFCVIKRNCLN